MVNHLFTVHPYQKHHDCWDCVLCGVLRSSVLRSLAFKGTAWLAHAGNCFLVVGSCGSTGVSSWNAFIEDLGDGSVLTQCCGCGGGRCVAGRLLRLVKFKRPGQRAPKHAGACLGVVPEMPPKVIGAKGKAAALAQAKAKAAVFKAAAVGLVVGDLLQLLVQNCWDFPRLLLTGSELLY
eukprot:4805141-Amphidinium_carterae.1